MPFTVSPGASSAFTVTFDPTAEFARLATLLIHDNAFDAPQVVALGGMDWCGRILQTCNLGAVNTSASRPWPKADK
jgi:hypothetical protein